MTDTETHDDGARLAELVKGVRIAMLTTPDATGALASRPLTVQRVDAEGTVWFLVDAQADWVADRIDTANVAFVDDDTWVSVTGTATLVQDPAVIDDLGDPVSDAWFDEDTPPGALRIDVGHADYWSAPGKLAQLFQLGKAALTQDAPDMGDRGTVAP